MRPAAKKWKKEVKLDIFELILSRRAYQELTWKAVDGHVKEAERLAAVVGHHLLHRHEGIRQQLRLLLLFHHLEAGLIILILGSIFGSMSMW